MNKSDLEIAQESKAIHIKEVAKNIDLDDQYLECYGNDKAKISLDYLNNSDKKDGKLILVTAINPTRAGEGKSTTTVGLGDALNSIGKKTVIALREPSQGPVFGLKGGAAGGGYAQVIPMEDLNLHFTGDMHAITSANNLISACLDNYIYQGNELNIDINSIVWKRALDMNDRVLRNITIGQGSKFNGLERQDGFYITVASEIMAVLCLCNSMADLRQRIRKMIIAYTVDKRPVTVGDLNIHGAVCVILKDAIKPNLVQTLENNPVIIHGGPFANIAHGCNSILATKTALKLGDYVVTEAGFGADLGAEKFLNIKARVGKLKPDAVVIVATIRALKLNGEVEYEDLDKENINAMLGGCANLEKHVRNIKKFNLPFVICINKFITDTDNEVEALIEWAKVRDYDIELSEVWEHGSNGGKSLAKKIVELCEEENYFKHLYDLTGTIEEKINTISKEIYGAKSVVFSELALEQIKTFKKNGWDRLAICMAKTPISLSDDPKLLGCPKNFDIHVKEIKISNGAGFIVVLTGNIMTMPGLPQHPAAYDLDIDMDGKILGNF